jgi:transcriptional regulator with XRE-family HTH domain
VFQIQQQSAMRERITQIINSEKITPAEFADKIGVQRSSLSHVINGRNNPGFSFIQKILETFPTINSRWLLTGQGTMFEPEPKAIESAPQKEKAIQADLFAIDPFSRELPKIPSTTKTITDEAAGRLNELTTKAVTQSDSIEQNKLPKKIERVLIFYRDRTFGEYRPT